MLKKGRKYQGNFLLFDINKNYLVDYEYNLEGVETFLDWYKKNENGGSNQDLTKDEIMIEIKELLLQLNSEDQKYVLDVARLMHDVKWVKGSLE